MLCLQTQGFSDPMSILGLDLWRTILARLKPTMSTEGKEGLVWNLHGREYFHVSNMLKTTGGSAMVNKTLRTYDKSIDRAFSSINIEDYTPSEVPEGAKGIAWKSICQLWKMSPNIIKGLYKGDEAMKDYIEGSNAIIDKCYTDECSKDELFGEAFYGLVSQYGEIMYGLGGLTAGLVSKWVLHRMFSKREDAYDHLINLCMDLNGNPTSEMGHLMVQLASNPEFQSSSTGEDFLRKMKDGTFSQEFVSSYNMYLKKFGCRGIREIDAATPRTHENQTRLFDALKAIDINNNQIMNVRERRNKAYQELLNMAKELGKEKKFIHHAHIMQSLLGFREHPKYM